MSVRTDLHCHLLPGLDDGAPDLQTAEAMLDRAAADGVTRIVATPHYCSQIHPELLASKQAKLAEAAQQRGIALLTGTEYNFRHLPLALPPVRLGNAPAILLDFRNPTVPPDLLTLLDNVLAADLTVVIAHPERTFLTNQYQALRNLFDNGIVFQVTASSAAGDLGPGIQHWTFQLLEKGIVQLIASDAHDAKKRPCRMAAAEKVLTARYGREAAAILFGNADALLDGAPLQAPCCQPLPWYRRLF